MAQIKLVGNHRGKEVILGMNLDDTEISYSGSGVDEIVPEITLSQYDYSDIDSGGQTFTVIVTSNVPWEIVDSYDWFACDPEYGEAGDTTVTVTVDANATEDPRAGVIVVIEREIESAILNLDQ